MKFATNGFISLVFKGKNDCNKSVSSIISSPFDT